MKVKSHIEDVDQLLARAKLATVKNKSKQEKFATIGCPLSLLSQNVELKKC